MVIIRIHRPKIRIWFRLLNDCDPPLTCIKARVLPWVARIAPPASGIQSICDLKMERHGSMSSIFKSQIDWIPLAGGAIRATQGKTLALMQVSGGSQSFNSLNQMRILGRWMRMITIPNQSSIPKAFLEFEEDGRMKPSAFYDRIVDVMEELFKFTLLTRGQSKYLTDRYSERKESAEELSKRVNQRSL